MLRANLFAMGFSVLVPSMIFAQSIIQLEEKAYQDSVARMMPSVVRIETFGGTERIGRTLASSGPTSGLVVSEDGYVISSSFNFVRKPSSILVIFSNGEKAAAEIVARDHSRMLTLLKVNTEQKLVVPRAISRGEIEVGQWAIAVGRTFDQAGPNVSIGIVSAVNRIWSKAVQTDAKISPSNYGGPLLDIQGRVIGVLVPLSPQGRGEVAGAEWYDSGIGFAIPLEDIFKQLDELKSGKDLYPGILGVVLEGNNLYNGFAKIAACHPNGPATKAGLKKNDTIIQIDQTPIIRQAQLKHVLGSKYADEQVQLVVRRDNTTFETEVLLTDELDPFEHPFLGVLPVRTSHDQKGVVIRYVYPDSPADHTGLQKGDQLVLFSGEEIIDAESLRKSIAAIEDRENVDLVFERSGQMQNVKLSLGVLPTLIPDVLPVEEIPAWNGGEQQDTGVVEIKLPESPSHCFAYIPENYNPQNPAGVVVWFHAPGGFDQEKLIDRWKDSCTARNLILLAPQSQNPSRWQRTEVEFSQKALNQLISRYKVDSTRIVAHGYQAGAAMAYLLGFAHRELVRGIAAVDATIPRLSRPPDNDPFQRLAIYTTVASQSPLEPLINQGIQLLRTMKYPVTVVDQGTSARYLADNEFEEFLRWVDSLDRL